MKTQSSSDGGKFYPKDQFSSRINLSLSLEAPEFEKSYSESTENKTKNVDGEHPKKVEGDSISVSLADTKSTPNSDTANSGLERRKLRKFYKEYGGMLFTLVGVILFSLVIVMAKVVQDSPSPSPETGHKEPFKASGLSFWRYVGCTIPSILLIFFYECRGNQDERSSEEGGENGNEKGKSVDKKSESSTSSSSSTSKSSSPVFAMVWPLTVKRNWITLLGLILRGVLGSAAQMLRFYALEYLTIGDTAVISNSSPLVVSILAHFLLGEKTGVVPILMAVTALCGVVVILKPPLLTGEQNFDSNTLIGMGFAVGSLLSASLMIILMRKVRKAHLALMLFIFAFMGLIQSFVLTQIFNEFRVPFGLFEIGMVSAIATCSFFGQTCTNLGLKMETAGVISLVRTSDVVFGFLFQFIFLGVAPDHFSSIGASLVFLGILVIAFRKYVSALPKESKMRRKFRFILY